MDRHEPLRRRIEQAVFDGPGETPPALRRAVAEGNEPPELAEYLAKVREDATGVTDEQVAALRLTWSDDALFELTVAVAVAHAGAQADAALTALDMAFRRDDAASNAG